MRPASVLSVLRYLVILLALGMSARAHADDRADARAHYQAGMKYYSAGDYRGAIREFSAAQQILPADLNNYNLGLCYDKLGDPEPAIQYYRSFLDRQPNTDKRAEIEASISRLEAAARSVASKKLEDQRRADEARKAEAAREDAARARADDGRRPGGPVLGPIAPDAALPPGPSAPVAGPTPPSSSPGDVPETRRPSRSGPAIAGSIGPPSSGTAVPTGDPQLDRVNSIDIDQIRDQRQGVARSGIPDHRGTAGGGIPDHRGGPSVATSEPSGTTGPVVPPSAPLGSGPGGDQPRKEDPVYKKWWFWVVLGVSAVVVYQVVSDGSESVDSRGRALESTSGGLRATPGGFTLRW